MSATLANAFTYVDPPVVSSLDVTSGPAAGGTHVTITGTGFTDATGALFDGAAATDFVVVNDTTVTCTTPAGTAGYADVAVTGPYGDGTLAAGFAYTTTVTVDAVTPSAGSFAGGTPVTLTGSGFTGATSVTFGGVAATDLAVIDDNTATCNTPAHASAVVDVVISGPFGSGTLAAGYTYRGTSITSIAPPGSSTSGVAVTITGSGFTDAVSATFGGVLATDFVVVNDTTITCTAPAHVAGTVTVAVQGPYGAERTDTFSYHDASVVFVVTPSEGTTLGGTSVVITGTGFTDASSVTFGGVVASSFEVINDTTVTCVTPAHAAGAVDVNVSNPYGSTPLVGGFTYVTPAPLPHLVSVDPTSGTTLGGTLVTLTGTDMTGVTGVTFGGFAATEMVVVDDTTVTCRTPAHYAGAVIVTALADHGFSSLPLAYTFVEPPPEPPEPGRILTLVVSEASALPLRAPTSTYPGAIAYDPANGCAVTETMTRTLQPIAAEHAVRLLAVEDASQFPDEKGWLVFGFGFDYQIAPVPYLGRASGTQLLLDPTYIFPTDIPTDATINLLTGSDAPTDGPAGFWLTGSPAGRVAAAAILDDLAAAGVEVQKTVLYPGDHGLGNEGYPVHGQRKLSDIVECFAGDDVDTEVEEARNS